VPNHEGIYQTVFRSAVSVEISGQQGLFRLFSRKFFDNQLETQFFLWLI